MQIHIRVSDQPHNSFVAARIEPAKKFEGKEKTSIRMIVRNEKHDANALLEPNTNLIRNFNK